MQNTERIKKIKLWDKLKERDDFHSLLLQHYKVSKKNEWKWRLPDIDPWLQWIYFLQKYKNPTWNEKDRRRFLSKHNRAQKHPSVFLSLIHTLGVPFFFISSPPFSPSSFLFSCSAFYKFDFPFNPLTCATCKSTKGCNQYATKGKGKILALLRYIPDADH